jgi:hypothetical protein
MEGRASEFQQEFFPLIACIFVVFALTCFETRVSIFMRARLVHYFGILSRLVANLEFSKSAILRCSSLHKY